MHQYPIHCKLVAMAAYFSMALAVDSSQVRVCGAAADPHRCTCAHGLPRLCQHFHDQERPERRGELSCACTKVLPILAVGNGLQGTLFDGCAANAKRFNSPDPRRFAMTSVSILHADRDSQEAQGCICSQDDDSRKGDLSYLGIVTMNSLKVWDNHHRALFITVGQ